MLFHMSIAAQQPRRVAGVIAELWGGQVFRFAPISDEAWVAVSGDERGTSMEVYPLHTVLRESAGDADAHGEVSGHDRFTATHAALATSLDRDAVLAIAQREGWPAKYRKRGGRFGVIELWIEGCQMMEVLTPQMQAEYLATMKPANFTRMFGPHPASSRS